MLINPDLKSGNEIMRFMDSQDPGALLLFPRPYAGFFSEPVKELICAAGEDASEFFRQWDDYIKRGFYLAGFIQYEMGYAFEPRLRPLAPVGGEPLARMGVFKRLRQIPAAFIRDRRALARRRIFPDYWLRPLCPGMTWETYRQTVRKLKNQIAAGDTYQVNFTFPLNTRLDGNPAACFWDMLAAQNVAYAGFLRTAGTTFLSATPELFFKRSGAELFMRPMKGTAARPVDPTQARIARQRLRASPKNRAENIMIVDLIRNDLGKICAPGSIRARNLCRVENYRTLFQMTSSVTGCLLRNTGWPEIMRSLFPSGSVTGAPKIRTQQIIRQSEIQPRGIYTGALGWAGPRGQAMFSIPIRTLALQSGGQGVFNVGSGIVADSTARSEWQECQAKAAFLTGLAREYQVIETTRWDPQRGFKHLTAHLQRMALAAQTFKIPWNPQTIRQALQTAVRGSQVSARVRWLLNAAGEVSVQVIPLAETPRWEKRGIRLSQFSTSSRNLFLYHKTTNRAVYDQELARARGQGLLEVVFRNESAAITEGAISNIFIRRRGVWLTPPRSEGLLPGIARERFLKQPGQVVREQRLHRRDLIAAEQIAVCNDVRGFLRVDFLA